MMMEAAQWPREKCRSQSPAAPIHTYRQRPKSILPTSKPGTTYPRVQRQTVHNLYKPESQRKTRHQPSQRSLTLYAFPTPWLRPPNSTEDVKRDVLVVYKLWAAGEKSPECFEIFRPGYTSVLHGFFPQGELVTDANPFVLFWH